VSNVSAAALAAILMARLDGQDEIPIFTSILHGAVRVGCSIGGFPSSVSFAH
jgi:hypothetical protein